MSNVVHDLVLAWTDDPANDPRPNPCGKIYWATPERLQLWFFVRDQFDRKHFFSVDLNGGPNPVMSSDGKPVDGEISWGLVQLGHTVWKIRPSVDTPELHAYVTIIDVPFPPPWPK